MSNSPKRYFVRQLDEKSFRPLPEAEFEVQILGDEGPAERCAYIGRDSNTVVALINFTLKGPKHLPVVDHQIPLAVIEAARQRRLGFGEFVNERGDIVRPSFLPPSTGSGEESKGSGVFDGRENS